MLTSPLLAYRTSGVSTSAVCPTEARDRNRPANGLGEVVPRYPAAAVTAMASLLHDGCGPQPAVAGADAHVARGDRGDRIRPRRGAGRPDPNAADMFRFRRLL